MEYKTKLYAGARADLSVFNHGRRQAHVVVHADSSEGDFARRAAAVAAALRDISRETGLTPVFVRWFLSDAANQSALLPDTFACARSVVQQAPLDGSKVAVWAMLEEDADFREASPGVWTDARGRLFMGDTDVTGANGSESETRAFLMRLSGELESRGASLLEHCVRTWFMVRDVDLNYGGVVKGRNEVFARKGLTRHTHFISSTGIEGRPARLSDTVAFNAMADLRLQPGQMRFVRGASHLNPTIEYGVAFERGTTVDYADRRHLYLSGTASIDNRGEIVHPGDVAAQTLRMLENIEVLTAEAECSASDYCHFLVYLRDLSDRDVVERIFANRYPDVPRVLLLAPVCRPGWLVEAECMAVRRSCRDEYAAF